MSKQIDYNRVQLLLAVLDSKDTRAITKDDGSMVIVTEDAIQGASREQLKKDLLEELNVTNKNKPVIHGIS